MKDKLMFILKNSRQQLVAIFKCQMYSMAYEINNKCVATAYKPFGIYSKNTARGFLKLKTL